MGQTSNKTFNLIITDQPVTAVQLIVINTLTQSKPSTPFKPINGVGGVAPLTYSTDPSLLANLSINTTTGFISGTPLTTSTGEIYSVTITDSVGSTSSNTFTLVVNSPPALVTTITTSSISLRINQAINPSVQPIQATGGTGNLIFGITPGAEALKE